MSNDTQLWVFLGSLFTAVTALATAAVGALCYFLRRLVDKSIPEMTVSFEKTNANLADTFRQGLKDQLEQCNREHVQQEQRAKERHAEVMAVLYGRRDTDRGPFAGTGGV